MRDIKVRHTANSSTQEWSPRGQKGPRAAILVELKRSPGLTVTDLAERLGASLNAIRHHIKELEADSLVEHDRCRKGVGAPVFQYKLAADGEALFPRRYEETLMQLLRGLVEREGREAAVAMLASQFEAIEDRLAGQLDGLSADEKLELVTSALASEGFMPEWRPASDGGALMEHNCAILAVAEQFPEVCEAEERFLSRALGADIERRSHILDGCGACGYNVRFRPAAATAGKENG
ncbi:MAG TPA: winged helix-turn-helix transcriptional regulator [Gemmatimonadaceae bacterium]|nr:winged helix-turn-helix transcriptional regulator [Gemmatimonadaceae bacterium]